MKRLMLMCLLSVAAFAEDVSLKDGRILKNVQVVTWGESAVVARWQGGAGAISYDDWPGGKPAHAPAPKVLSEEEKKKIAEKRATEAALAKIRRDAENEVNAQIYQERLNEEARKRRAKEAIGRGVIIVGMTSSELIESWGYPEKINKSVYKDDVHEQWVYRERGVYVYLENYVVTSWN